MSDELILWYETSAQTGTPTLKVHCGQLPFGEEELDELEREVRSRYDRLARGTVSQVKLHGHEFEVKVEPGPNPRQPKLTLRLPQPGVAVSGAAPVWDWPGGFFHELRQLLEGDTADALPLHERGSLATALDELAALSKSDSVALSAVLLSSYLATAEQLCREHDTARAGVYVLALRGLGRLLPASGDKAMFAGERSLPVTWTLSDQSHQVPWLHRFFDWLIGLGKPRTDVLC